MALLFQRFFLVGVLAIPFLISFFPTTNKFDQPDDLLPLLVFMAFCGAGVALFIYLSRFSLPKIKNSALYSLLSVGFAVWTLFSFFVSDIHQFGFAEVLVTWICVILFLFFLGNESLKENLPWSLALTLIACNIVGVYGFLSTDHTRFFGFFYNPEINADAWPNALAAFFLLAFPFLFYVFFLKERIHSRCELLLKTGLTGLCLSGFWLSFSRAAFFAFLLAAGVFFFSYFVQRGYKSLPWAKIGKVIFLSLLFAALFTGVIRFFKAQYFELINVADRFTFSEAEGGTSYTERAEFFKGSLILIEEKPWFGYGPATFTSSYTRLQEGFLAFPNHNNLILKLGVEQGVPSILFFLLLLLVFFIQTFPFRKKSNLYEAIVWSSLLGLMAHHVLHYNFNFITVALSFWLILSTLPPTGFLMEKWRAKVLFGMIFILGLFGIKLLSDVYHFRAIWKNLTEENISEFDPWHPRWGFLQLREEHLDDPTLQEAILLKQLEQNPLDNFAWNLLGELYTKEGRYEEALQAYEKAIELNPKNTFLYYLNYATLLDLLGENQKLEELKIKVIPLMEEYQELYERNLHYTQATREMEFMIELAEIIQVPLPE